MVSAVVLFEPGWVHRAIAMSEATDPVTGESYATTTALETPGIGLLQSRLLTGFDEITPTTVKDERLVLFRPTAPDPGWEITANDEFISPAGHCWQATADGLPRHIPGHPPDYYAVTVRRAKEKEHD